MPRSHLSPSGRVALLALRAACLTALAATWLLLPARPAYAYVDPSVMTYTIQALAGVAVALSAMFGVIFRRTRRKIYKIFNIDENAHKAVEYPIKPLDPASDDYDKQLKASQAQAADLAERAEGNTEQKALAHLTWRKRIAFSLVLCLFCSFIVFIAPALELVGSNSDSLVFTLKTVWWVSVVFNVAIAVACAFALSALRGKGFYIAMLLVFCVTVAAYVQSLFLNTGMLPADGGFIGWNEPYFVRKKVVSALVWAAVIIIPLVISRRHRHAWLRATSVIAVALMIVQGVGVGSVAVKASGTGTNDQPYVTQAGLFTVAPQDNVIVFVLDTYDTSLLDQLRDQDPHLLDNFTDFTYFHNSSGTMIPTMNAVPYLLTGIKPAPGQDIGEYRATKYEKSTFISDIDAHGYSIGLYSDSMMMDYANPADHATAAKTMNIHPVGRAPISVTRTFACMNQMALYREAPWLLKERFWYYTSDINNRMIADSGDPHATDSLYELDDAKIKQELTEQGLTVVDDGHTGAFRFIHLFGPHFPFSLDAEGNNVGTNQSDQLSQAHGSLMIVDEYLSMLKEQGLYDDATIIVTADHGIWDITNDPVANPISPIMLVKPATPAADAGKPLQVSEMPISHDDFEATVIDAVGGDPSSYGSGMTVWQVSDPNRIRYFDATTNAGGGERFVEYAITGDILDLNNWRKTGVVWPDA